jgi:hypothetical protein
VRVTGDTSVLARPWRQALEALVAATAREGQPWSCPNARITLLPAGDHGLAQLEVEDEAGVRRRPVASPADVVPLGEAMLARVLEAPAAPPPPAPARSQPAIGEQPASTPPLNVAIPRPPPPLLVGLTSGPGPRQAPKDMTIDALVGARYTGPTRAVLVGPEVRATVGVDRWSAALVGRYEHAVAFFQTVPNQFSLASLSVGLCGGYRLLVRPVELTLGVEPTLGVVLMGGQRPGMVEPDVDTKLDMRLGARLGAAVPVTQRLRVAGALEAEGAPAALVGDRLSRRHALPSPPAYMTGLSLGLEVVASP